jgi:hypothetical protein
MPRSFNLGDRVCIRRYNSLLASMCLGTIQQIDLSAEGFYGVLLDVTGEVYLIAEWDLTLVVVAPTPASLAAEQTREVGGR